MALKIFLCGHGNWIPDNGFFNLPKGCTMTFYTHHAKTILQDATEKIVAGQYKGEPENVIGEYKLCPNMLLSPDSQDNIDETNAARKLNPDKNVIAFFAKNAITLDRLLKNSAGNIESWRMKYGGVDFVWNCCRYVNLPGKITGVHGFNASEDLLDDTYIFRDRTTNTIIRTVPRPSVG